MAIKKIKVGQFKDGLDMSAIREVKYLRELKHENVIEVGSASPLARVSLTMIMGRSAPRRVLNKTKLKPCARVLGYRPRAGHT